MRWLHRCLVVAGGVGLVWLVLRSDPLALWRDAAALGLGAAAIVAVALAEHALHARAWSRCFAPGHRPRSLHLLGAYLAGGAVNLVTPTATLGGEVVRGGLVPHGLPAGETVASVTADRLAMALADTAIGALGCALLVTHASLPGPARLAFAGAAGLLVAGVVGFLLLQRGGRLASLLGGHGVVRRLAGARRAERAASAAREIDLRLASLHAERPGDFRAAVALHAAGTSVGALQLAIFLRWLGVPFDLGALTAVWSIGIALDLFSFFVPARLGAQEASRMIAMSVAGLEPARGLLFSLVLRVEQLVWAGVGLLAVPLLATRRGARTGVAPEAAPGEASPRVGRDGAAEGSEAC